MTEPDSDPGSEDRPEPSPGTTERGSRYPTAAGGGGMTRRRYVGLLAVGPLVGRTTPGVIGDIESTDPLGYGEGGYNEGAYPVSGSDPVDRADKDDDGEISDEELQDAIREWAAGTYTDSELGTIVRAWARG